MANLIGIWKLVRIENIQDYLKYLGRLFLLRFFLVLGSKSKSVKRKNKSNQIFDCFFLLFYLMKFPTSIEAPKGF
jgi:hypothetical protein